MSPPHTCPLHIPVDVLPTEILQKATVRNRICADTEAAGACGPGPACWAPRVEAAGRDLGRNLPGAGRKPEWQGTGDR